jgi:hypothetical protein
MSKEDQVTVTKTYKGKTSTSTGDYTICAVGILDKKTKEPSGSQVNVTGSTSKFGLISLWVDLTVKVMEHLGPEIADKLPAFLAECVANPEKYQ